MEPSALSAVRLQAQERDNHARCICCTLPDMYRRHYIRGGTGRRQAGRQIRLQHRPPADAGRSEEHTSELQSLRHLVCRLLLEKKKKKKKKTSTRSKK